MQLRFAREVVECVDPAGALERADHTCRWTGFRSKVGMRAYVEEDGTETVACSVSFAARHAGMLNPDRHVLAWVPEMSQAEVGDVARMHALALRTYRKADEKVDGAKMPPDYDEVISIRQEIRDAYGYLRLRAETVETLVGDSGLPVDELLWMLPADARERVMQGLRVLPVGFGSFEVESWVAPGASMEGAEISKAFEARWFSGRSGEARTWGADVPAPAPVGTDDVTADDDSECVQTDFFEALLRNEPDVGPASVSPPVAEAATLPVPAEQQPTSRMWAVPLLESLVCADGFTPEASAQSAALRARLRTEVSQRVSDDWVVGTPEMAALVDEILSIARVDLLNDATTFESDEDVEKATGLLLPRRLAVAELRRLLDEARALEGRAVAAARTELVSLIDGADDDGWVLSNADFDRLVDTVRRACAARRVADGDEGDAR